jgi:predicted AAA+ superfamily ATPase
MIAGEDMYERGINEVLRGRLRELRHPIQVLQRPRQVGKTTGVKQVLESLDVPFVYSNADTPEFQNRDWIAAQWDRARGLGTKGARPVLVLDEVPLTQVRSRVCARPPSVQECPVL